MNTQPKLEATQEQILYAKILEKGMFIGLVLMFITFAVYVFGIMSPAVPRAQIPSLWSLPVHDYLVVINDNFIHKEHLMTGWSWFAMLGKGDFLNFLPVAILSGTTILCYLAVAPGLFTRGDKAMGIMALLEAIILALAASGLLAVGH